MRHSIHGTLRVLALLAWLAASAGAQDARDTEPETEPKVLRDSLRDQLGAPVEALHRDGLILDTHVDTPYFLTEHPGWKFARKNEDSHVDLPRLIEAGVDAPFMVVYTPAELAPPDAMLHAMHVFDIIHGWVEDNRDRVVLAGSPGDVVAAREAYKVAFVIGMENGSPILPGRLDLLRDYHRLGIRYLGMSHFLTNHLCDSSTDEPVYDGVSAFGRQVIEECNRLGILLDVSHVSDDTVRDLLRYSEAPIIASHSNARALCDHPRNLPDDLIRGIAEKGGVIQLNFASQYVSADYLERYRKARAQLEPQQEAIRKKYADDPEAREAALDELPSVHAALERPPLEDWFRHLKHVVRLVGEDHVGLGSDFDGVGSTPAGIDDVNSLRKITRGLLERDWSEESIRKFYGGNLLRAWRRAEMVAEDLRKR